MTAPCRCGCAPRLEAAPATTRAGGRTPLHFAAARGHEDTLGLLLRAGVALEARSGRGVTPLQMASEAGFVDAARALLAAGANVEAQADEGRMAPLHVAAAMAAG